MRKLMESLVRPIVSRLGTAVAMLLIAKGYESPLVEQLINAATAFVLVAIDFMIDAYYRSEDERKTKLGMMTDIRAAFDAGRESRVHPRETFGNEV